jgi:hypothetical protein
VVGEVRARLRGPAGAEVLGWPLRRGRPRAVELWRDPLGFMASETPRRCLREVDPCLGEDERSLPVLDRTCRRCRRKSVLVVVSVSRGRARSLWAVGWAVSVASAGAVVRCPWAAGPLTCGVRRA